MRWDQFKVASICQTCNCAHAMCVCLHLGLSCPDHKSWLHPHVCSSRLCLPYPWALYVYCLSVNNLGCILKPAHQTWSHTEQANITYASSVWVCFCLQLLPLSQASIGLHIFFRTLGNFLVMWSFYFYRTAWILYLFFYTASSMYSKRHLGEDYQQAPPDKKLKANLAALFCQNDISGQRAASLFQDAHAAGAANMRDVSDILPNKNSQRNLSRRLNKRKRFFWPPLYYAKLRVFDKKTQKIVKAWCPMFLPHEIIFYLLQKTMWTTYCSKLVWAQTLKHMSMLAQGILAALHLV